MNKKQIENLNDKTTSVTEENVEITQVTSDGNVVIHPVTKARNVKYGETNVQEVLDKKVCLDGESQNFNFIGNKVVQGNLLSQGVVLANTTGTIVKSEYPYTLMLKTIRLNSGTWFLIGNGGWGLTYNSNGYMVLNLTNGTRIQTLFQVEQGEELEIAIQQTKDGLVEIYNSKYGRVIVENTDLVNLGGGILRDTGHGCDVDFLVYNRILTPEEIQHNLSVLDNTPSIKELHTTDADGKTSILKFASDTDHVEDRTGETQEQINRAFYKRMCKEFASTDGSPITINNGEEGYVLSGEIKGQTVKNYCPTIEVSNFENYAGNKIENNIVTIHGNGAFSNAWIPYKGGLEPNKAYKCVAIIYENTLSGTCNLFGTSVHEVWQGTSFLAQPKQTGIIVKTLTTKQDIDSFPQISRGYTTSTSLDGELIKYSIMVLDENSPVPTSYIPFGLSSTQAIISNNSQEYPIYEPTIQGKTEILNGQLISLEPSDPSLPKLGSVEDVADTINMVTQDIMINAEEFKLSSTMSNWRIVKENVNTTWFQATLPNSFGTKGICNVTDFKFNTEDNKHVYTDKTSLNVFFDKMSLNDFKNYIDNNDIVIRSILTEPQKHQLTQEQLKAYDAHKKVISLPFAEDKVTIDEDGSATWINASSEYIFTGNETFRIVNSNTIPNCTVFEIGGILTNIQGVAYSYPKVLMKDFKYNASNLLSSAYEMRTYLNGVASDFTKFSVPNDIATTVEQFKKYIVGKTLLYNSKPVVSTIPKELVPTILTNKTNILQVESAVKPSNFKVTLPVDRIAEIEARLQALENTTVDVVLNK